MDGDTENTVSEPPRRLNNIPYNKLIWAVLGLLLLGTGGFLAWQSLSSEPLLPPEITQKITGFTPYFYERRVPGGYTVDQSRVLYDGQVLMIPLTKAGVPSIILTEQQLPQNLPDENVQQNGESVTVTTGKATINNVEGRLVGTLLARQHRTLILLSSPNDTNKDDLKMLLQKLRPISRP